MNCKNIMIALMFLSSCSPNVLTKDFFCARSYDEIKDPYSGNYEYQKMDVDYHFPELGTISTPVSKLEVRNKGKQTYTVVIMGKNTFIMDKDSTWNTGHVDSVYCTGIAISGESTSNVYFTQRDSISKIETPIPRRLLKKLREDFFVMNKNKKYDLKDTKQRWNGITTYYPYKLYNNNNHRAIDFNPIIQAPKDSLPTTKHKNHV